jgi:hypothetical protein
MPAVQITVMEDISRHLGVRRIVAGVGIPYPCGSPNLPPESDFELRRKIAYAGLQALSADPADRKAA